MYYNETEDCSTLIFQRNLLIGILIVVLVISIIIIACIVAQYRSKFKMSKDLVMSNQATKFVKIVREIRGQENRCGAAKTKGYCPKKDCLECNNKDDNEEELPKTILIYVPKAVNLDEETERKLNLLAMSEDMRNFNCFIPVSRCSGKCLEESTNTSMVFSETKSIIPSSTKSDKDIV
uniref:Uncharacterized protein n=1 Tax=Strongyloides papillosus TaxID=174720 RepID=A0A0N5B9E9_STREA